MSPASLRGSHGVYDPLLSRTRDRAKRLITEPVVLFKSNVVGSDQHRIQLGKISRRRSERSPQLIGAEDPEHSKSALPSLRSPARFLAALAASRCHVGTELCPSLRVGRHASARPRRALCALREDPRNEEDRGKREETPAAALRPRLQGIGTKYGFSIILFSLARKEEIPFFISRFRRRNQN